MKLDTNGSNPEILRKLIDKRLLDYVAMDVKAPLVDYREVVGREVDLAAIESSIRLIRNRMDRYEFRTTVVPGLIAGDDLEEIVGTLSGSKRYVIQQFKPGRTLCPEYADVKPYDIGAIEKFRERIKKHFDVCALRL